MKSSIFILLYTAVALVVLEGFESDSFSTEGGPLSIHFIGHGTLMFEYAGEVIHVDPVSREADYGKMPKADLILITHAHFDHLDKKAIEDVRKSTTRIILNEESASKIGEGLVMKNGDVRRILGLTIEATSAYNTTEGRERFHPQHRDNGYLIMVDDGAA